jgi:hypothetical protein
VVTAMILVLSIRTWWPIARMFNDSTDNCISK